MHAKECGSLHDIDNLLLVEQDGASQKGCSDQKCYRDYTSHD